MPSNIHLTTCPLKSAPGKWDRKLKSLLRIRGIGIPPQDLVRVFDKFYRVHRPSNVEGTGLGLSICKGFVEAHGGRIWAENRPGGGTIIKVALPIGADTGHSKPIIEPNL